MLTAVHLAFAKFAFVTLLYCFQTVSPATSQMILHMSSVCFNPYTSNKRKHIYLLETLC